jgi:hypothetical protein
MSYPFYTFAEESGSSRPFTFRKQGTDSEIKPFGYSKHGWNEMRRAIEEGREPGEPEVVVKSTGPIVLPPDAPGGVVEDLPYQTKLSITGRKLIGIEMKSMNYPNADREDRPGQDAQIDMQQELQVKIKGQVGRKINVNVDFDDTQPDKRDISVRYKGDPDEVIQEAAFGDIDVALKQTEFVGYRKQVFGAKVHAKYKNADGVLVWSQSKGTPETKRFTGNAQMKSDYKNDTSYMRRKYYQLAFGTDTVKPGTEKIYVDDRNATNDYNTVEIYVSSYAVNVSTIGESGNYDLLKAGEDYTVDYYKGMVVFRRSIGSSYIIAVDYEKNDSQLLRASLGTTNYILIKDEFEKKDVTRELKNYYSIGRTNITPDNGLGNFTLYVEDTNKERHDEIVKYIRNSEDTGIAVDYRFFIEYRYVEKIFDLKRINIIPHSERIVMDGKTLERDVDYSIDYDFGRITFYNEDRITETTVIDISYEYGSLLGMDVGETFIGTRGELQLAKNMFVGSSYLSNIAPGTQSIPDLRSAPGSLSVGEVDARLTNFSLGFMPLTMSVSGELAQSHRNPNVKGRAIVDSMEGVRREDSASLNDKSWQYGSNPGGELYPTDAVIWDDEEVKVSDINPGEETYKDERQRVLRVDYNLSSSTECSIVQSLSRTGADYQKKLYLELWIYGDGGNGDLEIDLARQLNEDVDGDGYLDTEDILLLNGTLDLGEDVGWHYDVDGTSVGVDNDRLDTEDLDRDNYLDTMEEVAGKFKISDGWDWMNPDTDLPETHYSVDWTGWKYFRIPLNIADKLNWTVIKQLRVTINNPGKTGSMKFAKISVVGNKWENLNQDFLEVYAVNNQDDPGYAQNSLPNSELKDEYDALYGSVISMLGIRREQTLALKYDVVGASEVVAKTVYTQPQDFSQYRKFKFFLYGVEDNDFGEEFFIQIGANDSNYFEYYTVVESSGKWKLITIEQKDTDEFEDGIPDEWYPEDSCEKVGSPSFSKISQIKIGIRSSTNTSGEVWVNEIHVTDSWQREGAAKRLNIDFTLPGWMTFGYKSKFLDRNFETFTQSVRNQENEERSAYLNFTKIGFLPVSLSGSESITKTPEAVKTGELISVLQEGKTITQTLSGNASLKIRRLPTFSFTCSITSTSYNNPGQKIFRVDTTQNKTFNAGYTFPRVFSKLGLSFLDPIIPTNISGSYTRGDIFSEPWKILQSTSNPRTKTMKDTSSGNMSFNFWKVLSNFKINYSVAEEIGEDSVWEYNYYKMSDNGRYYKSKNQSGGISTSFNFARWLNPNVSYNVSANETYNFPISDRKIINRTGSGSLSWNIAARDILPHFKPVQSLNLNTNFSMSGGDKYENVASTFTVDYTDFEKISLGKKEREKFLPLSSDAKTVLVTDVFTRRYTGRWDFGGMDFLKDRLLPLKRTSINVTYSNVRNYSERTQTRSTKESETHPDLSLTFHELEKVFGFDKIISGSRLTYGTKYQTDKTYGHEDNLVDFSKNSNSNISTNFNLPKNYAITFNHSTASGEKEDFVRERITSQSDSQSYSVTVGFDLWKRRFTPKFSYSRNQSWPGDRSLPEIRGKPTADLTTRTAGIGFRWDTTFPGGLKIPLIGKTWPLTNRFVIGANFNWTGKESSINVAVNNTDQYILNMSADYDISQNFRCKLGTGLTYLINRENPKRNYDSFNLSGQLTIIF